MKEFFKKSTVYRNFKAEEDKELAEVSESKETENEIQEAQTEYNTLKKKYDSLQKVMLAQDTQNKANATKTAEQIHQTSHVKEPLMHTVPAPLD
jgi:hypothetical protein